MINRINCFASRQQRKHQRRIAIVVRVVEAPIKRVSPDAPLGPLTDPAPRLWRLVNEVNAAPIAINSRTSNLTADLSS